MTRALKYMWELVDETCFHYWGCWFIGFHFTVLLLEEGLLIQGYEGVTDYSDVALKRRRHQMFLQIQILLQSKEC